MRFCNYCEVETIDARMMVNEGNAVAFRDCCTKCGKPHKENAEAVAMPDGNPKREPAEVEQQQRQEQKPAQVAQVAVHPAAKRSADALIEEAAARLAQVEAELSRMKDLQAERATLRRMLRARTK